MNCKISDMLGST